MPFAASDKTIRGSEIELNNTIDQQDITGM